MTPAEIKADYAAMMNERGETVTIRRFTGTGANRPYFDAEIMAVVQSYSPELLAGSLTEATKKAIVLAQDLIDAQWPIAANTNRLIVESDVIFVRGKSHVILAADDATRRVATEIVAIELQLKG